jgi:RHS repeat-associated protein
MGRQRSIPTLRRDNLISQTDPTGATTRYVYNSCLVAAEIDPLGNRTSYSYGRFNNRVSMMDALGNIATWNYDVMGYPVSAMDAMGNVTTTVYNSAHQKIADIDALGYATSYQYDVNARLTTVQDARGNSTGTVYNARGDVIAQIDALGYRTTFAYDGDQRVVSVMNALGQISTAVYDAAGQNIANIDPLGHVTTMSYDLDGNLVTAMDANRTITTNVYFSNNNRLQATVDARGFRVTYAYDLAGQNVSIMDQRGNVTTMSYDGAGRLTSQINALGQITTWLYDLAGRNTTLIDGKGQVKTMTYDAVGNLVSIQYADGTAVTYQYDRLYRLTTMIDYTGTTTYAYSKRSELLGTTLSNGYVLTYLYDQASNRTTMIDAWGVTTYGYDSKNRLTTVINPFGQITTMAYDALDRVVSQINASGDWISHVYDAAGRQTFIGNFNSSGTANACFTGTFDNVGNQLTSQEIAGVTVSWSYDASYQLVNEQRNGSSAYNTSYVYDGAGNRISMIDSGATTNYKYDASNALTLLTPPSGSPTTSSYDANGNLTLENTGGALTTYSWDCENRLVGQALSPGAGGTVATHTYAGDGKRRTANNSSAGLATLIYDGDLCLGYVNSSNDGLALRATGYPGTWGGLISQRFAVTGFAEELYYAFDQQGNCRWANGTNSVFKGFGVQLSTLAGLFGYEGQYGYLQNVAVDTSHMFVGYRVLDVKNGRFISRDEPGFLWADANEYGYARCSPTGFVDPSGRQVAAPARPGATGDWTGPGPAAAGGGSGAAAGGSGLGALLPVAAGAFMLLASQSPAGTGGDLPRCPRGRIEPLPAPVNRRKPAPGGPPPPCDAVTGEVPHCPGGPHGQDRLTHIMRHDWRGAGLPDDYRDLRDVCLFGIIGLTGSVRNSRQPNACTHQGKCNGVPMEVTTYKDPNTGRSCIVDAFPLK